MEKKEAKIEHNLNKESTGHNEYTKNSYFYKVLLVVVKYANEQGKWPIHKREAKQKPAKNTSNLTNRWL